MKTAPAAIPNWMACWAAGLPTGTSTLLLGPAGTGKSTVATQFAAAAAARGERCGHVCVRRKHRDVQISFAQAWNCDREAPCRTGRITVQQVDPAELSLANLPPSYAAPPRARTQSGKPARMIIVDSLNGYLNAMRRKNSSPPQLHELLSYLGQQGVVTILTVTQAGMVGNMSSPVDTTYLADNVVLFRFFEAGGSVRRAVSVVKKTQWVSREDHQGTGPK
jgi:circadian clock protein KaiC